QLAVLAALVLATRFGERSTYSVWVAAQQVYLLPYAVLAVPLATSAFPRLAERAGTLDRAGFARLHARSSRVVVAVSLLGVAVLVAVSEAVAGVFVAIGIGETSRIAAMGPALAFSAPGVLGLGLLFHHTRALFQLGHGRLEVAASGAAWTGVGLPSLSAYLGLEGDAPVGLRTRVALGLGTRVGMKIGAGAVLAAPRRAAGPEALT